MAENAAIVQVKNFYNRLTTVQKIMIGSVIGVVVIGLLIIITSSTKEEMAVLYNKLEPGDASKITERLDEMQVDYELTDNGSTIMIEKDKIYDTRIDLAGEGLPETSVVGYEIFDRTNLGMSEFVQKLNYRRALEGELSRTIGAMNEVQKARVHIVIPEKALFEKDQKPPTASITLKLNSGRSLSRLNIEGIQNLTAASVEGMQPDEVTIVDQRGRILSHKSSDNSTIAGMSAQQYEQQMNVERYLSDKVQSLLSGVLGHGNSEVRVNADLDFTQIEKTITDFDTEKQIERSTQTIQESSSSKDSLSYPYVQMDKSQSNVITNYEIPKTVEKIVQGVGTIQRLSVAALINGSVKIMEKEGEKALEYVPRSDEEMQKLTEIVKNAIGYDPTRNDQVSVLNVPFDTMLDEQDPSEFLEPPWYENPQTQKIILMLFLMLIAVFVMFRLLRSRQVKERLRLALGLPEEAKIEEDEDEEHLEDFVIDDDELMLLPAELPEQLLLEGEEEEEMEEDEMESGVEFDRDSLASKAQAKLEETPEMTEDALMKLEIKEKVQQYLEEDTDSAVKLVKMVLLQDSASKGFNF